jgi:hypothetical protein
MLISNCDLTPHAPYLRIRTAEEKPPTGLANAHFQKRVVLDIPPRVVLLPAGGAIEAARRFHILPVVGTWMLWFRTALQRISELSYDVENNSR